MTPAKIMGLLLVIVYVVALRIFEGLDIRSVFEPPLLLPLLNTVFHGIIPIIVACVAGKSYLKSGSVTVLFMGCGMLAFGLCAISAGWVIREPDGPNMTVTIHNTGVFLASFFHATGAILASFRDVPGDVGRRKPTIVVSYSSVSLFLLCFSFAAIRGLIPPFFIQGVGPTELRQAVLGSSLLLYFISAIFFMTYYVKVKSDFLYWYSLCLALICTGLFGIFIQKAVGSPVGWLARSALYIGSIFSLTAIVSALKDAKVQGRSLEQSIVDSFQHTTFNYGRRLIPVLPIPIFLLLLVILASLDLKRVVEPPGLFAALNTLFLTILPLSVVYFATRSYLSSGFFTMLMLGSGALTLGLGSLLSGWTLTLQGGGPNASTTIFNMSSLFSAIFHLLSGVSVFAGRRPRKVTLHKGLTIAFAYLGVVLLLGTLTLVTMKDLVPMFFLQGQGPTALRQTVLGSAVALFTISGLLLLTVHLLSKARMLYWYSVALLLLATGLICYMGNTLFGGPIGWLGRFALYLAGVYLLVAVISATRELRTQGESQEEGIRNLFRHHLESMVEERTLQLQTAHNELERANTELSQTNQRLRALMEALPVGVSFSNDVSCQRITGNPCLFAQFDTAPDDNLSASAPDLTAPGRLVRFFHNGRKIQDTELPLQRAVEENRVIPPIELEVQLPGGRSWIAEASGAPIRDDQGNVVGGVAVTVDITERKKAEQDLQTTLKRFYSILSNQYAGLLLVSQEGGIEFANQAFCDQFDLKVPPSALLRLTPQDIIKRIQDVYAEPSQAVDRIREIVQQRKPVKDEEIAVRGGKTYLRDFIPIMIDGKPFGRLWHHRDISDRRQAEEEIRALNQDLERRVQERTAELEREVEERKQIERALRESEGKYKALYEGSVDGIFLLDDSGRILDGNEASLQMYGYSLEEIRGTKIVDLIHPEDLTATPFRFQDLLHGEILRMERRMSKKDGSYLTVEVTGKRVGENLVQGLYRDITERKFVEEVKRRALEQAQILEKIFDTTHFCVVYLDRNFNFIRVNPAYADVWGYPLDFFPGKNHFDLYPHQENEAIFRRVVETGETFTVYAKPFEFPDDPSRGITYWDWTLHAVKDPQGSVEGLVFVLLEVTERKRAEDERASAAKEIEDLYNNAPCGYHSLDSSGVFVRINDTELSWLGYTREEIIGKMRASDLCVPESLKIFEETYPGFMERGWIKDLEFNLVRKDGTILPVLLSATAVKDSSGNFVMSRSTMFDITDRKRAEEGLRESENRYRQMFQNSRAVKLLINPESYEIVDANHAASHYYGYKLDHLKQMKIIDINVLPPEKIRQRMSEAYTERENYFQFQHRLASGEVRYVEVYSTPMDLHGKRLLYSIVNDITDRRRAEEELIRSNEDLQQFAYVASHDLQEPLRNVASCLQMLEKKYKSNLDADADKYIHYAVESAVRMKALILDLLAYSRIAIKGKPPERVNCEQMLVQTVRNLTSAISETGATITHDPLPTIPADGTQLLQVFQNLIQNAIKFRKDVPPQIHVSAIKNKNEWLFSVKDNGIGIESRHLDKIFVIFQRLHKRTQYDGTGMGLAIVKKVVERHGGRVWVESEPGVGTTFYFTIPEKGTQI